MTCVDVYLFIGQKFGSLVIVGLFIDWGSGWLLVVSFPAFYLLWGPLVQILSLTGALHVECLGFLLLFFSLNISSRFLFILLLALFVLLKVEQNKTK